MACLILILVLVLVWWSLCFLLLIEVAFDHGCWFDEVLVDSGCSEFWPGGV